MGSVAAGVKECLARLAGRRPPRHRLDPAMLPVGAADWLQPDNVALQALEARYAAPIAVDHWADSKPAAWLRRLDDRRLARLRELDET